MERIDPPQLGDWINARRRDWESVSPDPPQAFSFDRRPPAETHGVAMDALRAIYAGWTSLTTPGVVRFSITERGWNQLERQAVRDALLAACNAADQRNFEYLRGEQVERPGDSSSTLVEIFSSIGVSKLPVLGPGGRLTLFHTAGGVDGELVVRRRLGALPRGAKWRSAADVSTGVGQLAQREGAQVLGEFGYYESSRLRTQTILRPVYVFVVERPQPALGPGWRTTIVEPATDVDGLNSSEGLE